MSNPAPDPNPGKLISRGGRFETQRIPLLWTGLGEQQASIKDIEISFPKIKSTVIK